MRRIHDEFRASSVRFAPGSWNDPITIQAKERIATTRGVQLNAVTDGFVASFGLR